MSKRQGNSRGKRGVSRSASGVSRRSFLKKSGLAAGAAVSGPAALMALNKGAKAEGEPIPVGGAVPLTGWAASDGIEVRRGLEMAVEEVNALGGLLGRPIELHIEDTSTMGANFVIQALQRLIDRHEVHAVINGYNAGTLTAEYDTIADAGILYLHHNTASSHKRTIASDPERYFGTFMSDPADYWYGPGLMQFLKDLEESGQWTRPNNKLFLITGSDDNMMTIGNAIRSTYEGFGWEISGNEVVVTPISEWGPTLAKVRQDNPAVLAVIHWVPQDLAQFMLQFTPNPTNSIVYMQYGPSLQAFRDIGGEAVVGVTYSTVIAQLQDEKGNAFGASYKAKFGDDASPLIGAQSYDSFYNWIIAAAIAGGSGAPGDFDQNRKISHWLNNMTYRGVMGTMNYDINQECIPYPDATSDPSLGMPHQYIQIQELTEPPVIIAPSPYDTGGFLTPPWMDA